MGQRFWIGVGVVIAAVLVTTTMRVSRHRRADAQYHSGIPKTLSVTSESFTAQADIPAQYSCRGRGLSPAIAWRGEAAAARSYALLMFDIDVPSPRWPVATFSHWVIYNMPVTLQGIPAGDAGAEELLKQAEVGMNSLDKAGYAPLCPPSGKHRYVFRVYALDVPQIKPVSNDRPGVLDAMKGHILAYGELVGRFGS
jgi:Raf kinase inhibitor-like YbhB/YbcL family protein